MGWRPSHRSFLRKHWSHARETRLRFLRSSSPTAVTRRGVCIELDIDVEADGVADIATRGSDWGPDQTRFKGFEMGHLTSR